MYDSYDPAEARLAACHIVNCQSLMKTRAINPIDNRQRDIEKILTNFLFTRRNVNLNATNLKEAIENGLCRKFYQGDESWINAFFAKCQHTLLHPE